MGFDGEYTTRTRLLERYNLLIGQAKVDMRRRRIPSEIRKSYHELIGAHETYQRAHLNKTSLRAANTKFSNELSKFEKLLEEKDD